MRSEKSRPACVGILRASICILVFGLATAAPAASAEPAAAPGYRVIVHQDNPAESISRQKVSRLFLLERSRWDLGLVADDVLAMAADLEATFGLVQYRRSSAQFTAIGDEVGLLLVMKRGRILGFGEGRPAGVLATAVTLQGARPARYAPRRFPFQISSR